MPPNHNVVTNSRSRRLGLDFFVAALSYTVTWGQAKLAKVENPGKSSPEMTPNRQIGAVKLNFTLQGMPEPGR